VLFPRLFYTKQLELIDPNLKKSKKDYQNSGTLELVKVEVVKTISSAKEMHTKSKDILSPEITKMIRKIQQSDSIRYTRVTPMICSTHPTLDYHSKRKIWIKWTLSVILVH
jgi:hypothetical protein